MTMKIRVLPAALEFEAMPGESILASALRHGIDLPSSCRNGTCRACLSYVQSGSIKHLIEWPGLSAEEKQDGAVLICVACPVGNIVIKTANLP